MPDKDGYTELKWWPVGKPIPAGYIITNTMTNTHHGYYAVLLERIDYSGGDQNEFSHNTETGGRALLSDAGILEQE